MARRPAFPGKQPALSATTGQSAISVTRFSPVIAKNEPYIAKMRGEDAVVVLFQLLDHPAHEFKLDGRLERPAAAPKGTLNIVDLRIGDACGRLLNPVDTLMFHIPIAALTEQSDIEHVDPLRAPDPWMTVDPVVQRLAPLLVDALSGPEGASDSLLHDHMLLGLSAHFAHRYGGLRRRSRLLRGGLTPRQEQRAKEMLAADIAQVPSISEIARECSLSPDHFARAFKVSTGVTPSSWFQERRIARAKALLHDSSLSLAEIAQVCGFTDQSHFSRQFSRQTGESPLLWRRSRN